MKKLNNELKDIITSLEGKMLMIGNYDTKITETVEKNTNISFCDVLSNSDGSNLSGEKDKSKTLNIKKLRKHYKKKKLNYVIVEEDQVKVYKNTFVKDSIYITNQKIYMIVYSEDITLKMYKRYTKDIEIIYCLDGKIICIDVASIKSNRMKDFWYNFIDILVELIDLIGNILMN